MMEKLIRHLGPFGSPGKGCGEQAEHSTVTEILIALSCFCGLLSARKPKHPSGHPPVFMGSNFASTPLGGMLKPLMVNYTFGGNGLGNKRPVWPGIKGRLLKQYRRHLKNNGFREKGYLVLNTI